MTVAAKRIGMPDFRILSLDGGGTWALIQVKALMAIYGPNKTGHQVLQDFDLVAANSGGSIVAGALACDFRLADILGYFKDAAWRDQIFVGLPWYQKLNPLRLGVPMPRYDARAKLDGLRCVFGKVGDLSIDQLAGQWGGKPHLLITAFDYERERAVFFRTNSQSPVRSFAQPIPATLAQAVHASTNAPIKYFDAPAAFSDHLFWDGAMSAVNNPVLIAVTEAVAFTDKSSIRARSIGTGSVFRPIDGGEPPLVQPRVDPGYLSDITKAAGCILDDPPDAASFIAYAFIDGRFPAQNEIPLKSDKLLRLNPLVQPVRGLSNHWVVPGADLPNPPLSIQDFERLIALEIDARAPDDILLIERFCDAWLNDVVPNQPVRANSSTLECEIGHRFFSDAKAVW